MSQMYLNHAVTRHLSTRLTSFSALSLKSTHQLLKLMAKSNAALVDCPRVPGNNECGRGYLFFGFFPSSGIIQNCTFSGGMSGLSVTSGSLLSQKFTKRCTNSGSLITLRGEIVLKGTSTSDVEVFINRRRESKYHVEECVWT